MCLPSDSDSKYICVHNIIICLSLAYQSDSYSEKLAKFRHVTVAMAVRCKQSNIPSVSTTLRG